jgi:GNAT superfamily N-acetyltransferase
MFANKVLSKLGIEEKKITDSIRQLSDRCKRITLQKIFLKLWKLIYEDRNYLYYRLKRDGLPIMEERDSDIKVQHLEDLSKYSGSNPWITKQNLISEASKRISDGEILYTITKDGILAHYGWMTKGGKTHRFTVVDMTFDSPKNSIILYDFYTDPKFRRQGLYQRNLRQMLSDSYEAGCKEVYIGSNQINIPSRRAIEKVGFSLYCIFSSKRILWMNEKKKEYH